MTGAKHAPANVVPLKQKKCPQCHKPGVNAWRPFCSKRCADLDLGAWLNESYRLPTEEQGNPEDDSIDDT